MNYLKLINWFWLTVPHTDGYKPLYGMLFLAIVDGINRNSWRPNTFMDYERISHKCKFTKEVYLNGRKWLMENKFIDFVPGKNNTQMASFSLGPAVGIPTGSPTGDTTESRYENRPARLPNSKHINKKHLNNNHKTNGKSYPKNSKQEANSSFLQGVKFESASCRAKDN